MGYPLTQPEVRSESDFVTMADAWADVMRYMNDPAYRKQCLVEAEENLQKFLEHKSSAPSEHDLWTEYELRKKILFHRHLTPDQYDVELQKIVDMLGI